MSKQKWAKCIKWYGAWKNEFVPGHYYAYCPVTAGYQVSSDANRDFESSACDSIYGFTDELFAEYFEEV